MDKNLIMVWFGTTPRQFGQPAQPAQQPKSVDEEEIVSTLVELIATEDEEEEAVNEQRNY